MISRQMMTGVLFIMFILSWAGFARASLAIQSDEGVDLEIKGYDGLNEITLFQGMLIPGVRQNVDTSYRGLGLLLFDHGQVYPVIINKQLLVIKISSPDTIPSFKCSGENQYFYRILAGGYAGSIQYNFADLMIEARKLLVSTSSIRTLDDLQVMKEKFHTFVRRHYQDLCHSDMLRRLIAQYFMMHEYVDYHVPGTPATSIKTRYQEAVVDGVCNWLAILKADIPQHEIFNYCISLYYNRSMVSLAALIISNFKENAYCPGEVDLAPTFSPTLNLIDASGKQTTLQELIGKKTISFVSDNCPVSKVETIVKARQLARYGNESFIIVPLQPLSKNHLSMNRMVSGGNMMFVDDESWRKANIPKGMKLPQFIQIEEK